MLNRFDELPEVLELKDCLKKPKLVKDETLLDLIRPSAGVAPPTSCTGGSSE